VATILTKIFDPITSYFRETWAELKKVRWPTRQEAQNLTLIVLAVTVGMALLLGTMDAFFAWEFTGLIDSNITNIVIAGVGLVGGIVALIFGMREQ
jgi:preprotein translocase subunit SecE